MVNDGRDPSTSERILKLVRGGDQNALGALVERYLPGLHRFAHNRLPAWARSGADTADIVQSAITKVLRHVGRFESRHQHALRHYLQAAIRNQIRDEMRRIGRTGVMEPLDSQKLPSASTLDEEVDRRIAEDRFRRGLSKLKESEREIVVARLLNGYSYDQIALMSGRRTADSARMAVKRAIEKLAEAMRP